MATGMNAGGDGRDEAEGGKGVGAGAKDGKARGNSSAR